MAKESGLTPPLGLSIAKRTVVLKIYLISGIKQASMIAAKIPKIGLMSLSASESIIHFRCSYLHPDNPGADHFGEFFMAFMMHSIRCAAFNQGGLGMFSGIADVAGCSLLGWSSWKVSLVAGRHW